MPVIERWEAALEAILRASFKHQAPDWTGGSEVGERIAALSALIADRASEQPIRKAGRELFGSPPVALVSFDADRIHDYILGTAHLAEMRGASALIREELSEERVSAWLDGDDLEACFVVFADGGSGLVVVPGHLERRVCEVIEHRFVEETCGGMCTSVATAFWPEELVYGRRPRLGVVASAVLEDVWHGPFGRGVDGAPASVPFGRLVAHLGSLLRRRKAEKFALPGFAALHGLLKRCDSCGLEPAEEQDEDDLICERCAEKRRAGHRRAADEARSVDDVVGGDGEGPAGETPKGYVAVVHVDANGMGSVFERLGDPMQFRIFSTGVSRLYRRCRTVVARELGVQGGDGRRGRYQAPVFGGDDIVLIVPAAKTVDAVVKTMTVLGNGFRELAAKHPGTDLGDAFARVTVSCGFVVAPSHFPMHLLFDYADSLLGNAKRRSYQEKGMPPAVDFLVLKDSSPLSQDLEDFRKQRYSPAGMNPGLATLTKRPYLLKEFETQVVPAVRPLGSVPGGQRTFAAHALMQDPAAAKLEIAYQVMVREKDKWAAALTAAMGREERWLDFFLEETPSGAIVSRYFDVLELCEAERR